MCGLTIYYPEQITDGEPEPYPWAIAMRGKNPAVFDVELLNPYQGIDASQNESHNIRNITGQPLRRGIWVDAIYDIGRIENVHSNPWWSSNRKLLDWQMKHGRPLSSGGRTGSTFSTPSALLTELGIDLSRPLRADATGTFLASVPTTATVRCS